MSLTFTLKSHSSSLSADFYPPIQLDPNANYHLALIGFHTYNSIPNIENGCNAFHYTDENLNKQSIIIPTGTYEIEDIESYLRNIIEPNEKNEETLETIFSLKPNCNTLKCEMKCKYDMDFTSKNNLGYLLGFSPKQYAKNIKHESDLPVHIIKVVTIRIDCNIINGSYYNSESSHSLYEFSPTSDPGFSIDVEPRNLIYLPTHRQTIDNISLRIVDQDNKLINFRGEEIIVRLELKKS